MLQQLVTTTFTNFGCEALDQLRDSQSHKCKPGLRIIVVIDRSMSIVKRPSRQSPEACSILGNVVMWNARMHEAESYIYLFYLFIYYIRLWHWHEDVEERELKCERNAHH